MKYPIGTIFQITVGMPGPDMDTAIVTSVSEDGYGIKRYSAWTGEIKDGFWDREINAIGISCPYQIPGWALNELNKAGRAALREKGGGE